MKKIEEIALIFASEGPAITQAQTARLLERTTARVAQLIKEKKLETVECLGIRMITIRSIIKYTTSESVPACNATPETYS